VLAEEEEGKEREKQSLGRDERHRLLSLVYEYFLGGGLRQLKEVGGSVIANQPDRQSGREGGPSR
jgi:hypothetical protein